ncbi:proline-rich receptor-like protein kinase PERK2 [Echria macrotheca]|uniref:Proline-rich receptor-like protein kinase PERK2 n=1 Tax=Echria macrotheca TaxID=438768 RepID=A0AAJ0F924_9PEZI|nr:proline-rich receptor-like protein kinase PERK2 [Echria macrotheca]
MAATVLVNQAPINLGPLTTTFTPPPACTVAVGAVDGGLLGIGLIGASTLNVASLGQTCSKGKGVDATSCWPPTSSGAPPKSAGGWGFYSPGVQCPVGYATACMATGGSGGGSEWPVQFKLLAGETAAGCCPSGYACANINGQTCTMIATSTTVPTVTCDGSKSGDFGFQTVPDAKASITAFSLFAPMIQINWQSSDLPATTSKPGAGAGAGATKTNTRNQPTATSGTQTIDTAIASGMPTLATDGSAPLPSGSDSANSSNNSTASPGDAEQKGSSSEGNTGLATTTKVGLGIGGAVAAIALVVGTVMYVWRRRRHQREEQELDRLYGMKHNSSTNLADDDIPGWYRGQRPAAQAATQFTPTMLSPYRPGAGASELDAPASPYYRPYRP